MFNVTRRDMGEFAFFMSQPVAITIEDLVRWVWRNCGRSGGNGRFEAIVGYIWVFAWFSFSLQLYIKGLMDAEVIRDWILEERPLDMGAALSRMLLEQLGT